MTGCGEHVARVERRHAHAGRIVAARSAVLCCYCMSVVADDRFAGGASSDHGCGVDLQVSVAVERESGGDPDERRDEDEGGCSHDEVVD